MTERGHPVSNYRLSTNTSPGYVIGRGVWGFSIWDCLGGPKRTLVAREEQAIAYARWLAERSGVDLAEATGARCCWAYKIEEQALKPTAGETRKLRKIRKHHYIESVEFVTGRRPSFGSEWEWISAERVALIVIPNANPDEAHRVWDLSKGKAA